MEGDTINIKKNIVEGVDRSCKSAIEIRFETLILKNCDKPWDWYKDLKFDKGWASRVRRGLIIPLIEDRVKIANYFKTDSSAIWKIQDINNQKVKCKVCDEEVSKKDIDEAVGVCKLCMDEVFKKERMINENS